MLDKDQSIHEESCFSFQIEQIMKDYEPDEATYRKVSAILLDEMRKGLGKDTNATATIKMFPTYVRALPDGSEKGNILALDLGGTNFRVLLIKLDGCKATMENKIFPIPESIMTGTGTQVGIYL